MVILKLYSEILCFINQNQFYFIVLSICHSIDPSYFTKKKVVTMSLSHIQYKTAIEIVNFLIRCNKYYDNLFITTLICPDSSYNRHNRHNRQQQQQIEFQNYRKKNIFLFFLTLLLVSRTFFFRK